MGRASAAKEKRKQLRAELTQDARQFWHGGASGMIQGTLLIPGNKVPGYAEILRRAPQEDVKELAPNWVYVTTDRDLAIDFAAQTSSLFGAGALYEIQPLDLLVPDPDFAHVAGVSYRVKRARVMTREQGFEGSYPNSPTGASLGYATWDDGTPMYDSNGLPLPNATQAELGVTVGDLRGLDRGASWREIDQVASRIAVQKNPGITQESVALIRAKHRGWSV